MSIYINISIYKNVNFVQNLMMMFKSSIWNKGFVFSCMSCFFLFANFYMLLAAMPLAVKEMMDGTARDMSLVVSIYLLGIVLLRPFSGVLVDKLGKRQVSLITIFVFAICSFLYLGIDAIIPLLFIRFVHGLFHAVSTTGHAAMAIDMLPIDKKGEGIGYYGLAMSLSMVLGPALGLFLLNTYGYVLLIIIAGFFAVLSYVFTFLIPKSQGAIKPKVKQQLTFSAFIEAKSIPVCIAALVFSFSYSSLISFIAVYTKELNLASAGMYFFIVFAISILVTRPYIGKMLDRRGPSFLMFPALLFFAIGILFLSLSSSIYVILCLAVVLGISYGAIFPSFQTITVRMSPANRSGVATATFFLFYDLGFGLGAFILAIIASTLGYAFMFQVVSVLALVSLLLYYFLFYKKQVNV